MADHILIPTSAEVVAVIRARHGKDLQPFGSFSDPDGTFNGGAGEVGRMETSYGFRHCDFPILEIRTRWDIDQVSPHKRLNETHEYWLCIGKHEE